MFSNILNFFAFLKIFLLSVPDGLTISAATIVWLYFKLHLNDHY